MGAAIALRRLVPVKVIGSRMRIVFILLAVVVFEAAHSTVTEFDEVEAFDTANGSEEMELDQEALQEEEGPGSSPRPDCNQEGSWTKCQEKEKISEVAYRQEETSCQTCQESSCYS